LNKIQTLMTYVQSEVLAKGKAIGKIDVAHRFIGVYQEMVQEGVLDPDSWEYKVMGMEAIGGDCPVCGKTWLAKRCKPVFTQREKKGEVIAEYEYFIPACNCIPHCPLCNNLMLVEFYEEETKCRHCDVGIRCQSWVDQDEGFGANRRSRRVKCKGYYRPMVGGFVCDECGDQKRIFRKQGRNTWNL
jgi:hypothetical protein